MAGASPAENELATGAVALQRVIVKKAYARAGVDVDLGNRLKREIQSLVKQTHGPQVLGKIGGFGGLFRAKFPGMREPVLVASIDGVGTKLKIAFAMNKHDTVGADLVNHCVNDIAVLGARPLFFLDYIGCEKLEPRVFHQLLRGLSRACRVGRLRAARRRDRADARDVSQGRIRSRRLHRRRRRSNEKSSTAGRFKPGDVILGLASNGLHTNGYSLARKILFEKMRLKVDFALYRDRESRWEKNCCACTRIISRSWQKSQAA